MEKSRQVCAQGGVGKGRNALGTACGGPAAHPSAALQTTPPCTRMQSCKGRGSQGREQLSVVGRALMKA